MRMPSAGASVAVGGLVEAGDASICMTVALYKEGKNRECGVVRCPKVTKVHVMV